MLTKRKMEKYEDNAQYINKTADKDQIKIEPGEYKCDWNPFNTPENFRSSSTAFPVKMENSDDLNNISVRQSNHNNTSENLNETMFIRETSYILKSEIDIEPFFSSNGMKIEGNDLKMMANTLQDTGKRKPLTAAERQRKHRLKVKNNMILYEHYKERESKSKVIKRLNILNKGCQKVKWKETKQRMANKISSNPVSATIKENQPLPEMKNKQVNQRSSAIDCLNQVNYKNDTQLKKGGKPATGRRIKFLITGSRDGILIDPNKSDVLSGKNMNINQLNSIQLSNEQFREMLPKSIDYSNLYQTGIGTKRALTSAERQHRYRQKLKNNITMLEKYKERNRLRKKKMGQTLEDKICLRQGWRERKQKQRKREKELNSVNFLNQQSITTETNINQMNFNSRDYQLPTSMATNGQLSEKLLQEINGIGKKRALTSAERQHRYRQKLKSNIIMFEKYKERDRFRKKNMGQTLEDKICLRQGWRERKQKQRKLAAYSKALNNVDLLTQQSITTETNINQMNNLNSCDYQLPTSMETNGQLSEKLLQEINGNMQKKKTEGTGKKSALTSAERQHRYRQKLKCNIIKFQKYKESDRLRKKNMVQTLEDKICLRRGWRERKQKQRKREKALNNLNFLNQQSVKTESNINQTNNLNSRDYQLSTSTKTNVHTSEKLILHQERNGTYAKEMTEENMKFVNKLPSITQNKLNDASNPLDLHIIVNANQNNESKAQNIITKPLIAESKPRIATSIETFEPNPSMMMDLITINKQNSSNNDYWSKMTIHNLNENIMVPPEIEDNHSVNKNLYTDTGKKKALTSVERQHRYRKKLKERVQLGKKNMLQTLQDKIHLRQGWRERKQKQRKREKELNNVNFLNQQSVKTESNINQTNNLNNCDYQLSTSRKTNGQWSEKLILHQERNGVYEKEMTEGNMKFVNKLPYITQNKCKDTNNPLGLHITVNKHPNNEESKAQNTIIKPLIAEGKPRIATSIETFEPNPPMMMDLITINKQNNLNSDYWSMKTSHNLNENILVPPEIEESHYMNENLLTGTGKKRALTSAERQHRYRQKLKCNIIKFQKYKESDRLRNKNMLQTLEDKIRLRRGWRERKQKQRKREKELNNVNFLNQQPITIETNKNQTKNLNDHDYSLSTSFNGGLNNKLILHQERNGTFAKEMTEENSTKFVDKLPSITQNKLKDGSNLLHGTVNAHQNNEESKAQNTITKPLIAEGKPRIATSIETFEPNPSMMMDIITINKHNNLNSDYWSMKTSHNLNENISVPPEIEESHYTNENLYTGIGKLRALTSAERQQKYHQKFKSNTTSYETYKERQRLICKRGKIANQSPEAKICQRNKWRERKRKQREKDTYLKAMLEQNNVNFVNEQSFTMEKELKCDNIPIHTTVHVKQEYIEDSENIIIQHLITDAITVPVLRLIP